MRISTRQGDASGRFMAGFVTGLVTGLVVVPGLVAVLWADAQVDLGAVESWAFAPMISVVDVVGIVVALLVIFVVIQMPRYLGRGRV